MMTENDAASEAESGESLERLMEQAALSSIGESEDVETKKEIVRQVLLSESYKGSFAHPHILAQLEKIIPGGAERAFSMTEEEQRHRHECDKILINSEVDGNKREYEDRRLVIYLTFAFLFVSLILAFVAVITGHKYGAGVAGGGVLLALLGLFGLRKRSGEDKESGK